MHTCDSLFPFNVSGLSTSEESLDLLLPLGRVVSDTLLPDLPLSEKKKNGINYFFKTILEHFIHKEHQEYHRDTYSAIRVFVFSKYFCKKRTKAIKFCFEQIQICSLT